MLSRLCVFSFMSLQVFSFVLNEEYIGCLEEGSWLLKYRLESQAIVDIAPRMVVRSIGVVRRGLPALTRM